MNAKKRSITSSFWIGYRTFIDKMNIVFMMMNTLDVKKIQKTQELKLAANKL